MKKGRSRFVLVFLACVILASSSALAAGAGRTAERFDDFVRTHDGGVIAVAPENVDQFDPADPVRAGWDAFRNNHGGSWAVYLDRRTGMPTMVSGSGVEWFPNDSGSCETLEEMESRARSLLERHRTLLGDWSPVLALDAGASGELREGHWQLVFRQEVNGIRVENARLEFQVRNGRMVMFGSSHWGVPTTDGLPAIDVEEARAFLDSYLDTDTSSFEEVAEPELVIVALDADPPYGIERPRRWTGVRGEGLTHALIWRLKFQDPASPAMWTGEIDAHDGAVRAFYDGAHYAGVRGGVIPEAPDVGCSNGGCELDDFPMPYADWTESGQAASFTDLFGNLTCSDPGSTFETTLVGTYVRVDDTCGPVSETAGCGGTLQLGLKGGENCDVAPGASPGNTAAARSSFYHMNHVAEVARFYNPDNLWLGSQVTVHSNWNGKCNASWGNGVYVYQADYPCSNSGEIQGIVVHEWGHGYDENDGGGWDNTSEAYADVVAMLASRASCFGPGLFIDGRTCTGYGDTCLTCTGFRDHDWAARQANTPATPQVFVQNNCIDGDKAGGSPCGGQVHCETYPIVESIFDLATRDLPAAGMDVDTAWQLVERLWYSTRAGSGGDIYTCALPISDSCSASSWYQRLRVADDDDGDLANGTPHAAELYAAFARHNIACGSPGAAGNQSNSSCAPLATPVLIAIEMPFGTELSWSDVAGAAGYHLYRGELGCNRQQVVAATLPASTTAWVDALVDPGLQRYYRVEAIGVNEACRSAVSNCETTPAGPRLQKNAHRMIEDGANADGDGYLEPGETIRIPVTLYNGGAADAVGVSARLRTVDPVQGRVVDPVAMWPDISIGSEYESYDPHFELTLFESGVACGETVEMEIEMDAGNAAMIRTRRFEWTLGERDRDFHKSDGQSIQRQTPVPVISTLDVVEERTIAELDVTVAINHPDRSELIVELTSPEGTTVRLNDAWAGPGPSGIYTRYDLETDPDGPGTMADFEGESILGTWTLSVEDIRWGVYGLASLSSWTLHVTADGAFDCDVLACAEPAPTASPGGLHVDKTVDGGDGSVDLLFSWDGVTGAAGYHVLHSSLAPFDFNVDLTGRTSGETMLTVEDGAAMTPPMAFFLVRAVNTCNQEGP